MFYRMAELLFVFIWKKNMDAVNYYTHQTEIKMNK